MGCGGSNDKGSAKPRAGTKKKKAGKGSAKMAKGENREADKFWDDENPFQTADVENFGKLATSDGYASVAVVKRSINDKAINEYCFHVKKCDETNFRIGLVKLAFEEGSDEPDSEDEAPPGDWHVEKSWMVNFGDGTKNCQHWDSDDSDFTEGDEQDFGGMSVREGDEIYLTVDDGKVSYRIGEKG